MESMSQYIDMLSLIAREAFCVGADGKFSVPLK